ncbi:MAG: alpha/beta hydrolase [Clostridia bacterium]|nr:alpha/beta hydrolase [Clostridia bacterium]
MKNKNNFTADGYFSSLYEIYRSPYENVQTADGAIKTGQEIKQKLSGILAVEKIPFKTRGLVIEELKSEKRKNYTVRTLKTEICDGLFMLCYLLEPERKTDSGIVAFCGHGYGCRQIIRQSKRGKYRRINFFDNYQKNFAEALALSGHTVIVPEPLGFGQAKLKKDMKIPFYSSSCDTLSHHALLYGFSVASLRVYQVMRCIDILELYGARHIGCMGISGGGLVTLYASCLDERIEKSCVCGYINTFKTSVLSMWHCPDNYIPGILEAGEMYDFAAALSPKKLMMQFGNRDKLFPVEGSRLAAEKIRNIYKITGHENNFTPVEFDGKHEVFLPAALEFFNK